MKSILLLGIRFYRSWISTALPGSCRFAPSCSTYAQQALEHYGVWKASLLVVRRLLRCHPFHSGGYDPVPGRARETEKRGNGDAETKLTNKLGLEEGFISVIF